jgi:hypothetical protein
MADTCTEIDALYGDTGNVPVWFAEKLMILLKGHHVLSLESVDTILEHVQIWGVCSSYTISPEVVIHSGLAGVLSRFREKNVDVPFLAHVALGDMMFKHGCDAMQDSDGEHPLTRAFKIADRATKRQRIERKLIRHGGDPKQLGYIPRTALETAAIEELDAHNANCYPSPATLHKRRGQENVLPEDSEQSDKWVHAHVHPDDLHNKAVPADWPDGIPENHHASTDDWPDGIPTTMQTYSVPAGSLEAFAYHDVYCSNVAEATVGDMHGPNRVHNGGPLPFLNPRLRPVLVSMNLNEYKTPADWAANTGCNSPEDNPFEVKDQSWFGPVSDASLPMGKGILRFVLGTPSSLLSAKTEWQGLTGEATDVLQFNGHMKDGVADGLGDLLFQGRTLYSGVWVRGCCETTGSHLPGVKGFSFRQVYAYYLHRSNCECRLDPEGINLLQVRRKNVASGDYEDCAVNADQTMALTRKQFLVSGHVLRLIRRPETRGAWIPFTAGCGCQDFTKLIKELDKSTKKTRVVSAVGNRESWYQPNKHEFVVYEDSANEYSMFEPVLTSEYCVGLEFVGNNSSNDVDTPTWVGLFDTPDVRYALQAGVKWSITDAFVRSYFCRYVGLAMRNPNVMLDLLGIAEKDRDHGKHKKNVNAWHLDPRQPRVAPGFRFWVDKPADLVSVVQGCVKNIYEVMFVPGGRWRFFARFNHDSTKVTNTWYQLNESWMHKFMKPQCVHDVFRFAKPFHRVNVHKTGQKVNAVGLECVKRVVLAIVPPDDHEVIAAVEAWPAEVDFESKVGRLCDLSSISNKYHYNARRVKHAVLTTLFADELWDKDVDIIMRPTDAHGTTPHPRLPLSFHGCLISK